MRATAGVMREITGLRPADDNQLCAKPTRLRSVTTRRDDTGNLAAAERLGLRRGLQSSRARKEDSTDEGAR